MFHSKVQKYGIYPIKLLFLQVRPQKLISHQKGAQNILAGTGHHLVCIVRDYSGNTVPAGTDNCGPQGSGRHLEKARRRHKLREDTSEAFHDTCTQECGNHRQESGTGLEGQS